MPLFTAMVTFDRPLLLPLDAFALAECEQTAAAAGSGAGSDRHRALWWAARNNSKPGLGDSGRATGSESWTLISTPRYALAEIQAEPMQDAATGAFKPQENSYLNGVAGPCNVLLSHFKSAAAEIVVGRSGASGGGCTASSDDEKQSALDALRCANVVYMQGQRWGSAVPAPASVSGRDGNGVSSSTVKVLGVDYDGGPLPPLVYDRADAAAGQKEAARDFVADDALGLYFAGDFCSSRNPGFEAAVLSSAAAAEHIARAALTLARLR
jgi:heat shock protein HslJ